MTTTKRAMALPLAFAVGVLGLMMLTEVATATHPRPASATPLRFSLVPAYNQCTASNRTHGPPLGFPSCNPPVQASSFLTVGTPDSNGAVANSLGSVLIKVIPHQCCPDQDVAITGSISDVRCKPGVSTCGNANVFDGPDYTGELQGNALLRITDHYNATTPGGGTDPATVVDIPFPVNMQCASTADTSIGSTCSISSSAVAVGPPSPSLIRAVVEMTQFEVFDGGADGLVSTTGNTRFAVEGVFVP
jgi:hypothetical protein